MTMPPHATLLAFEAEFNLGPTFAARVLGVAYATYAQYRSGRRELPQYHLNQIALLRLLAEAHRHDYIQERLHGTRNRSSDT